MYLYSSRVHHPKWEANKHITSCRVYPRLHVLNLSVTRQTVFSRERRPFIIPIRIRAYPTQTCTDNCPPSLHTTPDQPSHPHRQPIKSPRRTSVPCAIENSPLAPSPTLRLFVKPISTSASRPTAPMGGPRVQGGRQAPAELGTALRYLGYHPGGQACFRIPRQKRTVSTQPSAVSVWRNLKWGCPWRDWNVYAGFTECVSTHGGSVIRDDVRCISTRTLDTSWYSYERRVIMVGRTSFSKGYGLPDKAQQLASSSRRIHHLISWVGFGVLCQWGVSLLFLY